MTVLEQEKVLKSMEILIDTREQPTERARKRYERFGCPYRRATLSYGDYACNAVLPGGEAIYDPKKTVEPLCVVERKMSLDELAACFCKGRQRFTNEFERAAAAGKKKQNRFFRYIRDLLGDFGFWRNPGRPADVWESRWINERKIAILHTVCGGTPDAAHPVSGDGEVDIWAPDRIWMGIRHACYLASTGEAALAFVYLEDAVSLMERLFALPEGTACGCGCRSLSGLSLTLCAYHADNARAVKFNRYPADGRDDLGFWGSPLHSSGIYHALTAEHGWEWFDPIREDPRYAACAARVRTLME